MEIPPSLSIEQKPELEITLHPMPISADAYLNKYWAVGKAWNWLDRLTIPVEDLEQKINRPGTEIYQLIKEGQFLGYAELVFETDFVELQYFGLVPEATGKGIGKYFLLWALNRAWQSQPKRVQVNTCSLDHPVALGFYKACGFEHYKTQVEIRKVPVL